MKVKQFRQYSIRKISIKILLILLILSITINVAVEAILKSRINNWIQSNNSALYDISFEKISTEIFRGNISFNNVIIATKPNTDSLAKKNNSLRASFKKLELDGIDIADLLFSNAVSMDKIIFYKSQIEVLFDPLAKNKDIKDKNVKDLNRFNLGGLNRIHIGEFKFVNFSYQSFLFNSEKEKQKVLHIPSTNFLLSGLTLENSDKGLSIKNEKSHLEIMKSSIVFDDHNYQLLFDSVRWDLEEQSFHIENFKLRPTLKEQSLADNYKYSEDIINVAIDTIDVFDFDFLNFFKSHEMKTSKIILTGLDLSIYKDKNKPVNSSKLVNLPHLTLKRLKAPIQIDKFLLKDSKINIKERIKSKDTTMQVFINNISSEIKNLTNKKGYKNNLELSLKGTLMGTAPIKLMMKAPLSQQDNNLYWGGKIGALNFRTLDKVLYPVLGLKVLSGELIEIDFKAVSNNFESRGEMTMLYKNLHASILKSNSNNENHFLTSIANGLIHKSNPNKRGHIKTVRMYYKRDQNKGLGNYIWKTLQNGIINTITPMRKRVRKLK